VRELNLPFGLLAIGVAVLAANLVTPVIYRAIIENGTDEWEKPGLAGWFLVVPALLALGNLLPRPNGTRDIAPSRSWMPFLILTLWVTGSAVHLYCVGYVSDLAFHLWICARWRWCWRGRVAQLADLLPQPVRAGYHSPDDASGRGVGSAPGAENCARKRLFFALTLVTRCYLGCSVEQIHRTSSPSAHFGLGGDVRRDPMDWGSWLTPEFTSQGD
jgi:hypothetical protein